MAVGVRTSSGDMALSSPTRPSKTLFPKEFHCRECGSREAFQSRPRGFAEKYLLPCVFLRAVRCAHCYVRTYVLRTIAAGVRTRPLRKAPGPQSSPGSGHNSRIA
jgi:hypothetical protein